MDTRWLGLRLCVLAAVVSPVSMSEEPARYTLQTIAGSDFAGDGGPAAAARLTQIQGIALDARGNLYIADADDHRIRKVTAAGIISTIAGTGHPGFNGDAIATESLLNTPYGIAVDVNGNVFFADLGNARIRRIGLDGRISTVAGGGWLIGAAADGKAAAQSRLKAPRNVAVDYAGNIYFSDFSDHRVWQITSAGTLLRLAGTGETGLSGDNGAALLAKLASPAGIALDSQGAVFVADTGNSRVRRIYRGVITTLGDSGKTGVPPSIPVLTPTGLAFDSDGSLYIADTPNQQILRVTSSLEISAFSQVVRDVAIDLSGNVYAGAGSSVYKRSRSGATTIIAGGSIQVRIGDGGPALQARMALPRGLARDAAGNLYVADPGEHVIRKITPSLTISTVAGTGQAGFSGDGQSATSAKLAAPEGIAVDPWGNLYIADSGNHRIRKVDPSGSISTIAGTGEPGYSGDYGLANRARLNSPSGIAVNANGDVYVADSGNHAIRQITPAGSIYTVAGTGSQGYSGEGAAPSTAMLNNPRGIALNSIGDLYIADTGNRRIRRVSLATVFGPGEIKTVPDSSAAIWRYPTGVAVDERGNVFVVDAGDHRVLRVETNGRVATIAGDGVAGFSGEAASALDAMLDEPSGLVVDAAGNVYASDTQNHRIRKITPMPDDPPPPAVQFPVLIANAASLIAGQVAPGEIVSLFGVGIGPETPVTALSGPIPAELGGVRVTFDGRAAPVFYAQSKQINVQVPYAVEPGTTVAVIVTFEGRTKGYLNIPIVNASPGLFTMANGTGQILAINEDGTLNSAEHPADRGSIVTFYATGEGLTTPTSRDGELVVAPASLPLLPITVRIGDYPAEVQYAAGAPGFAGLMQVNVRVPGGFAPSGTLPVLLQAGSAASQSGVTIVVK